MDNNQKSGSATYTFATWNMACACPGYHGRGLEGILKWINENDIDFFAAQEVDRFGKKSGGYDFPRYMADKTGMQPYYVRANDGKHVEIPGQPPREYGNLILSRFPLTQTFSTFLHTGPHHPAPEIKTWGQDKRVVLFANAVTDSGELLIGAVHLSNTTDSGESHVIRDYQARNLSEFLDKIDPAGTKPVSLGGDFNIAADAPELVPLYRVLECSTKNAGPTWPLDHTKPVQKMTEPLDHIFTRAVRVSNVRRYADPALSDHAAVIADITILKPKL